MSIQCIRIALLQNQIYCYKAKYTPWFWWIISIAHVVIISNGKHVYVFAHLMSISYKKPHWRIHIDTAKNEIQSEKWRRNVDRDACAKKTCWVTSIRLLKKKSKLTEANWIEWIFRLKIDFYFTLTSIQGMQIGWLSIGCKCYSH